MAVSRLRNEKYAIWPLLMAESSMNSAMGRYHVPQNVFLVVDLCVLSVTQFNISLGLPGVMPVINLTEC